MKERLVIWLREYVNNSSVYILFKELNVQDLMFTTFLKYDALLLEKL